MGSRKQSSGLKIFLKAALLGVALIAVVQVAVSLRSPRFLAAVQNLFADPRTSWNWCPGSVETVELLQPQVLALKTPFSTWCDLKIESVREDEVKAASFQPLMRARSRSGEEIVVESDASRTLFRSRGLPFRAPELTQALARTGHP